MMSFLGRLQIAGTDFKKISVIVLILVNLVPIFGIIVMGWQVFPILFLFWIENLIIGAYNVLKMILALPDNKLQWAAKAFMIPFFCVHYGLFTLVHGVFIFVLFGGFFTDGDPFPDPTKVFAILVNLQLGWAVLALVISHTVSLVVNYIGKGEYKKTNLGLLMQQPYGRVVILHITIIFGGFLVMLLGSPVAGLILLVCIKTFIDIKTHLRQHRFPGAVKASPAVTVSSG